MRARVVPSTRELCSLSSGGRARSTVSRICKLRRAKGLSRSQPLRFQLPDPDRAPHVIHQRRGGLAGLGRARRRAPPRPRPGRSAARRSAGGPRRRSPGSTRTAASSCRRSRCRPRRTPARPRPARPAGANSLSSSYSALPVGRLGLLDRRRVGLDRHDPLADRLFGAEQVDGVAVRLAHLLTVEPGNDRHLVADQRVGEGEDLAARRWRGTRPRCRG